MATLEGHFSEEVSDPYLISAAVDVGTSASCYAFCYRTQEKCDIRMNKNWAEQDNFESYKTPTAVLTEPGPKGKFLAFGYKAVREYNKLTEDGQTTTKNLYHDFKMLLYTEKRLSVTQTMVSSTSGTKRPLIDVFSMTLAFLKEHMLSAIAEQASKPKDSEIRWALTVPSIWSDQAKQFMRVAAFKAGLISREQSPQLLIVFEPSAAALQCRKHEANHFMGGPEAYENHALGFPIGMKYIVVDAGGGTVDFTAQETLAEDKVTELMVSNGGDWGGREVDKEFITLLKEVLGTTFIERFMRECPLQWYGFMSSFEQAKRNINEEGIGLNILLPAILERMYIRWEKQDLSEKVNSFKVSKGISESNGYLRIDQGCTQHLFQRVLQKISDHLQKVLRSTSLQNTAISHIFLVGGFSSCKLLHGFIKTAVRDITILTPYDAQVAIVKGALLYCNKPETIERLAKKTYGAATRVPFDPTKHPEGRKETTDKGCFCTDVFVPFFQKNETIRTGRKGIVYAEPVSSQANSLTVDFYSLDRQMKKDELIFIDFGEVKREASTRVNFSSVHDKKEVIVEFNFSDEVEVTVKNVESEEIQDVKINFEFSTPS